MSFVKLLWVISLFGFLGMLLNNYVFLTDGVSIFFDGLGNPLLTVSRNEYFYMSLFVFVLFNALMLAWSAAMRLVPPQWIVVPQKIFWFSNSDRKTLFLKLYDTWIKGLAACINAFAIMAMLSLLKLNDPSTRSNTDWVYYLLLGYLVFWLIAYYFMFNHTEEE